MRVDSKIQMLTVRRAGPARSALRFGLVLVWALALALTVACGAEDGASGDADAGGDGGGSLDGGADGTPGDASGDASGQDGIGEDSGSDGSDGSDGVAAGDGDAADDATASPEPAPPASLLPWAGVWRSNFGSIESIGAMRWVVETAGQPTTSSRIVTWDASAGWIVTQAAKDDAYNPSKFAKIRVASGGVGAIGVCFVAFGKASALEAIAAPDTADANDLDGKGCAGFPWTRLSRPEPAGLYESAFGGNERFDAVRIGWAEAVSWNNVTRIAISVNAKDDPYNPGKFNKVVWTEPKGGVFSYCTVTFGKDTAALAESATETADANDLNGKGCGGFPWTKLTAMAVVGAWQTNFGTVEHIDGMGWASARLGMFDNAKRVAFLQSAADDPYTPSQWSRVAWTAPKDGGFAACTEVFGKKTQAEAAADAAKADASDLDGKGCGGFPWTRLTAPK